MMIDIHANIVQYLQAFRKNAENCLIAEIYEVQGPLFRQVMVIDLHANNHHNICKYDIILHMGDFNFNDIDWRTQSTNAKSETLTSKFLDIVQESFLYQHVMSPKRQKMGNKPTKKL